MTKKKQQFTLVKGYMAPATEIGEQVLADLLCESPDGYTEEFGDIEDFTW